MSNILKKFKKENILYGILLFVLSIGFISICSMSTSPVYNESTVDSTMFQMIGKYWNDGYLPYRDLWDSKGPFIFWVNSVGFRLVGTKIGVYLIQILCMFVTLSFIFKTFKIKFSNIISFVFTIILLVIFTITYQYGNLTEEYALPLLSASFYFIVKWALNVNENPEHSYKPTFIYGLCFGVCLLSRVTNAMGLCVGVAFIVVFLIVKGKWKNLGLNAVSFIAGSCIVILPFVIYFALNGILDEMWYGTILYNFGYADKSSLRFEPHNLAMAWNGLFGYILLIVSILICIFSKKNRVAGGLFIGVSLVTHLWLSSSFDMPHYYMVELPYFAIIMVFIKSLFDEAEKLGKKAIKKSIGVLTSAFIIFGMIGSFSFIKSYLGNAYYYNYLVAIQGYVPEKESWRDLIEELPEDYKESFIAYNCETELYLKEDIKPACRFFVLQDFAAGCNETLVPKMIKSFDEANVKWILALRRYGDLMIQEVIDKKYEVYDQKTCANGEAYVLYKLKD